MCSVSAFKMKAAQHTYLIGLSELDWFSAVSLRNIEDKTLSNILCLHCTDVLQSRTNK